MKQTLDALACVERCYIPTYTYVRFTHSHHVCSRAVIEAPQKEGSHLLGLGVWSNACSLSKATHTHNRTHNTLTSQCTYTCRSIPGIYINTHPSDLCAVCVWVCVHGCTYQGLTEQMVFTKPSGTGILSAIWQSV